MPEKKYAYCKKYSSKHSTIATKLRATKNTRLSDINHPTYYDQNTAHIIQKSLNSTPKGENTQDQRNKPRLHSTKRLAPTKNNAAHKRTAFTRRHAYYKLFEYKNKNITRQSNTSYKTHSRLNTARLLQNYAPQKTHRRQT